MVTSREVEAQLEVDGAEVVANHITKAKGTTKDTITTKEDKVDMVQEVMTNNINSRVITQHSKVVMVNSNPTVKVAMQHMVTKAMHRLLIVLLKIGKERSSKAGNNNRIGSRVKQQDSMLVVTISSKVVALVVFLANRMPIGVVISKRNC